MRRQRLGKEGPELSVIGLGTWAMGGPWRYGWGPSDDGESLETIRRALDLGVNWIDTAPIYGLGHAEEIVGRAVAGRRDGIFLATKCGLVWNRKKKIRHDLTPSGIRTEVEASLKRLNTEVIDLYQFHWPDPGTPVEDSWSAMIKLREEGKVRWLGVSNLDLDLLRRCEACGHVDSLQPPYNLLRRGVESDLLPYCLEKGIGVLAYSPMHSGLLTGTFEAGRLAKDDWRRWDPEFQGTRLSAKLALVEQLRAVPAKHGRTVGQLAVAWVLRHPAVTAAIVGARNVSQVEENLPAADWQIDPADLELVERLAAQPLSTPAL